MKQILLYLWQLPQNLLGLFLVKILKAKKQRYKNIVFYSCDLARSGISLGQYIILDKIYLCLHEQILKDSLLHEVGHSIQSKKLGWFYLLLVGLPSITRNIWDRLFHKNWDEQKRKRWYYKGYPEKQANILGGVKDWSF